MTHPTAPQVRPVAMPQPVASPAPAMPAPTPVAAAPMQPAPMQSAPMQARQMQAMPVQAVPVALPGSVAPAPMAPPPMPGAAAPMAPMPGAAPVAPPAAVPAAATPPVPMSDGSLPPMMPGVTAETLAPEEGEKAMPAISIHAFCDRQDTAGVINESTRDWRMKRTNMKIYMGGLAAAIEFYQRESTPALILVETGMRGGELFNQLETLAGVCDENTRVVIIGAANDIRLYRQLMEKGVSDYLVPPFHPIALIRSLSELYIDPENPFTGRVTAFFGAKGGVGSSSICHNVAWQMAETLGYDAALVDLDASFGTSGLDFQYDHSSGLDEALADVSRLDEMLLDRIMVRHTPRLSLLPASGSLGQGVTDKAAFEAVVNTVRSVCPTTLLDMPHVWAEWSESILTQADDIVVTSTLDLAGLRNTKNLVDHLKARRPNDADPILIVNKVGLCEGISLEEFAAAVGLEPSVTFAFEPELFVGSANNGEMITDMKQSPGTIEGFQRIGTRLKTGQFPVAASSRAARGGLPRIGGKAGKGGDAAEAGEGKSFIKKLLKKG